MFVVHAASLVYGKKLKTNKNINSHKKLVLQASPQVELLQLLHVGHDDIILNLNVSWEKEKKRTVLVSSRRRADIL